MTTRSSRDYGALSDDVVLKITVSVTANDVNIVNITQVADRITPELKKLDGLVIADIVVSKKAAMTWIKNLSPQLLEDRQALDALCACVMKIIREAILYHNLSALSADLAPVAVIWCSRIPSECQVDFGTIHLYPLSGHQISLSGVDRAFKNCDVVVINPRLISGHALGVFNLKSVVFEGSTGWSTIVTKHLASKDVLSCQEELIDVELDDYAQL